MDLEQASGEREHPHAPARCPPGNAFNQIQRASIGSGDPDLSIPKNELAFSGAPKFGACLRFAGRRERKRPTMLVCRTECLYLQKAQIVDSVPFNKSNCSPVLPTSGFHFRPLEPHNYECHNKLHAFVELVRNFQQIIAERRMRSFQRLRRLKRSSSV